MNVLGFGSKFSKLNEQYHSTFSESTPLIFLHPDENRNYTDEELEYLKQRDFKTRILICEGTVAGNSVALRTHFTDNHKYCSHLNYIRDFYKATYVTKNYTAAKTTASELLNMFFNLTPSEYYSFAVTIASALSNYGENVSFEKSDGFLKEGWDENLERRKLCLLMDVLFSRIATYKFLLRDGGTNTYRVVHCGTKTSPNKRPLMYAIFSLLIQLCLTAYVVMENVSGENVYLMRNLPLAILTFVYSSTIAYPQIMDGEDAKKVYGKTGPLQMADAFVNQFLTVLLLFSGFFVILIQESYIEAVLNTAALLFIPEIDDQLPSLLGLEEEALIENYLTYQVVTEFDYICTMKDEEITRKLLNSLEKAIGVPFCDYYLCNIPEEPVNYSEGINFTPYQIIRGKVGLGDQIDPVSFVNEKCLIRKLVWSYTTSEEFAKTTRPRIGYLKIEKLNGTEVEIDRKGLNNKIEVSSNRNVLEGIFIITSFHMSDSIFRLRVCGAPTARDFLDAFEYYSLWGLSSNAKRTLDREAMNERKRALKNLDGDDLNNYVTFGSRFLPKKEDLNFL